MAVAKEQGREKPVKIEQRRGPQAEQTALLASPIYIGRPGGGKNIKRGAKGPGVSLSLSPACVHSLSLCLSLSRVRVLSVSLSPACVHSLSLCLSLSCVCALSLSLSLSFSPVCSRASPLSSLRVFGSACPHASRMDSPAIF